MRMHWIAAAIAALLLVTGCGGTPQQNNTQKPAGTAQNQGQAPAPAPAPAPTQGAVGKKQWDKPPEMKIDPSKQYIATMKTSLGDIRMELWPKEAPKAVNNFVFLAREGFYDGVIFHRIIKDFMIQGGDPQGTGMGGPGYRFAEELPPKGSYVPGILAMARTNQPNSQGSQFFICNGPSCANLDRQPVYTQFGKVLEGMEIVQKISSVEVVTGADGAPSKPKNPPVIKTIVIEEK